ncbi:ABC transporter substrate-binding protein, partial [Pseudomonas aeruginosa]|nr:ABC transporter substrate-binding protein [Pseudomonas aeruginosa]
LASSLKAGLRKSDVDIQVAGLFGVRLLLSAGRPQAMAGVPAWVVTAEDAARQVQFPPAGVALVSMA